MNLIRNFPVMTSDIEIAEDIWGKDVGALKGGKVCKIPTQAKMDFLKVPEWSLKSHNKVFVAFNVMFINRMPFMVSVLRNIKFNTVQKLGKRKKYTLLGGIDTTIAQYRK